MLSQCPLVDDELQCFTLLQSGKHLETQSSPTGGGYFLFLVFFQQLQVRCVSLSSARLELFASNTETSKKQITPEFMIKKEKYLENKSTI